MTSVIRVSRAVIDHYREGDLAWALRVWAARQLTDARARRRAAEWEESSVLSSSALLPVDSQAVLELPRESQLSRMIHRGDFELDEQCFVRTFLRPGDGVLDIGANIGLYAVLAALTVGDAGFVRAFEPNPERLRTLKRNVARNGLKNVVCSGAALSDRHGVADFSVVLDGWDAYSSLGPAESGMATRKVHVATSTLDDVGDDLGLEADRLRLVKIDVEGWEEYVLQGAQRTLSRSSAPVVIFEANERAASRSGSSVAAMMEALRSYGYSCWTFSRLRRSVLPYPPAVAGWSGNVYAIKDLTMVEERLGSRITWRLHRTGLGFW